MSAASNGHGKMYTDVYSVTPAGNIRAGRFTRAPRLPIWLECRFSVGFPIRQPLRHGAGAGRLSDAANQINLTYADGMLFKAHGAAA